MAHQSAGHRPAGVPRVLPMLVKLDPVQTTDRAHKVTPAVPTSVWTKLSGGNAAGDDEQQQQAGRSFSICYLHLWKETTYVELLWSLKQGNGLHYLDGDSGRAKIQSILAEAAALPDAYAKFSWLHFGKSGPQHHGMPMAVPLSSGLDHHSSTGQGVREVDADMSDALVLCIARVDDTATGAAAAVVDGKQDDAEAKATAGGEDVPSAE